MICPSSCQSEKSLGYTNILARSFSANNSFEKYTCDDISQWLNDTLINERYEKYGTVLQMQTFRLIAMFKLICLTVAKITPIISLKFPVSVWHSPPSWRSLVVSWLGSAALVVNVGLLYKKLSCSTFESETWFQRSWLFVAMLDGHGVRWRYATCSGKDSIKVELSNACISSLLRELAWSLSASAAVSSATPPECMSTVAPHFKLSSSKENSRRNSQVHDVNESVECKALK